MIQKPRDYDQTASFGESTFTPLPKGGYMCRINAVEETKDSNGMPMVHFAFDIIDGDYTSYFTNLYRNRKAKSDKPLEVKWPFEGQMWIALFDYENPSNTNKKFKGFCTALEDSGTEVWDARGNFLMENVKSAEIGIVFQRKEKEYNGKTSWQTVPWACRSVETILSGDYFVPEDKPLESQNNGYNSVSGAYNSGSAGNNGFNATGDDIPF